MGASTFRKVVVATDFSEAAEAATEWAAALAADHGATLVLLHAVRLPPPLPAEEAAHVPRSAAQEELDAAAGRLSGRGIEVRTELLGPPASSSIVEKASDLRADVIVTGAAGKTGLERFLLGSVAADIVQKSSCPVLTVKAHSNPGALHCILVPVDFSGNSRLAVEAAVALSAGSVAARLVLTHVLQLPAGFFRYGQPAKLPQTLVDKRERREAELEELAVEFRSLGHTVETNVRMGEAATEIVEEAKAVKPDVIAMGTHGRGPLGRALLGSTARHVLPRVPCPVLTVHRSEDR